MHAKRIYGELLLILQNHLDRIYRGEVESDRHKQYRSATTNKERHKIALSHGYGPILDDHWVSLCS